MKLTKKVNLVEAVENVKGDAFDIHDEVKAVDTPPYVDAVKRMERNKKKVKKAMEPAEKAKDELIDLTVKRKANKTPKLESLKEAKESGQHIYLFPICKAIEPILDCNYFGLRLLGANYFDGEENYVVKGDLSDLRDFAEYVGYELHPDYLYKDDEFAGEIVEIGNAVEESCKSLKENTDDNKTLKDVLSERKSFVVSVPLDSKYHLFIEGLSESGESIDGEFSIDKVYKCIVEVHETGVDLVDTLDGPFNLDTELSTLIEKAEEVVKSLGESIDKNKTLKENIVFDEVNGFHIEYGHSLEEYMNLWGDLYKEGELWDFSFDDVKSKAIEPNDNMVYWALIDKDGELRVYETYKFEEFEESCNSLKEDVKLICDLSDYNPWSGAVSTWDKLEELDLIDELDSMLEEMYPEGLTMTQLNDILWFESDWIFETLGVSEDDDEDDEYEDGEDEEEDFWGTYHKTMSKYDKKTGDLNEGNEKRKKTFSIPVTWEVWDRVEVEAETLEEAIRYVKENIDIIPLGTEPEYIDGSYKIYDGENGEATIEDTIDYLKAYWNLDDEDEEEYLEKLTESVDKVQAILNRYYVSKEDAKNKLGKEYIRALKKGERLPNKFRFLSGTDKSGIVEYEGKKYYWTLEKGNIKVSVHESYKTNKPEIEHIVGTGGVPCLLVNNRYQIYLDDGSVYDTVHAKDIPQYVFNIRDRAMKTHKDNIKEAKVPNYDWCKSEEQLNDRIKDLDKGESIMWNGFVIYNRNGNEYEYYHNNMEVMKSKSSEEVANYVFNFEYKKY